MYVHAVIHFIHDVHTRTYKQALKRIHTHTHIQHHTYSSYIVTYIVVYYGNHALHQINLCEWMDISTQLSVQLVSIENPNMKMCVCVQVLLAIATQVAQYFVSHRRRYDGSWVFLHRSTPNHILNTFF